MTSILLLIHGFQKKTQKTSNKEMNLAKEGLKRFLQQEPVTETNHYFIIQFRCSPFYRELV
ncbi:type II toxin-antitoxin system RelE/ParE family toxin [Calothrix sp. PCC 6303]|uniref:type II toxin-antitoxin system RelE/ParE family toxin n=1 Tax=Calothrix sp. PCC 6303 TaxID=1170562 RepID=UPI0011819B2B